MLYIATWHKHILQYIFGSFSVCITEGQDNIFAADLDIFGNEAINDSEDPFNVIECKVHKEHGLVWERHDTLKDLRDSFRLTNFVLETIELKGEVCPLLSLEQVANMWRIVNRLIKRIRIQWCGYLWVPWSDDHKKVAIRLLLTLLCEFQERLREKDIQWEGEAQKYGH